MAMCYLCQSNDEDCEDGEIKEGDAPSHFSDPAVGGRSIGASGASQPPTICRFFMRGSCTWGNSCRYIHPAPPDKGS